MAVAPRPDAVKILVVDDQPSKLLTYDAILSELGEQLIRANSASEALEALLKHEIAVVLADVCMPDLDGYELAAMIRQHPRCQRTSIIFVSAVMMAEPDRLRGYAAGAVDYVSVPIVPDVLRAKVRVFVDLYRKTRELELLNADLENRVRQRTAELEMSASQLRQLNEGLEQRIEQRTREREEALAQLFEAQKLDTIGHLTGGVAHDFNNLLMVILTSLELIRRRIPEDEGLQRLVNNAMQGAKRGATLTQRMLAFARRQELKPVAVDVTSLVLGMRDLLERSLGPTISLVCQFPEDLRSVLIDANQLELAILNLAVNARDAMPQGGTLSVSARLETIAQPSQSLAAGSYVCLSIVDEGTGMDAQTLARATEPFFTTKGAGKGTGLGLPMVHGLAAQSGGRLLITSSVGTGTTVELWLPTAPTDAGSTTRPAAAVKDAERAPSMLIVAVDDDALVLEGTVSMLQDLGHKVLSANSGPQALDVILNEPDVSLLITDQVMPGMSGTQLIEQLASTRPRIPAILATGFGEAPETLGRRVLRLTKPYDQNQLAEAIRKVFASVVSRAPLDGPQLAPLP